ncbi:MAG: hypothetical protein O3B95_13220 [Chloroflexi bacterium]|nr:hypothetical protein [Chloroflexota bacterium]
MAKHGSDAKKPKEDKASDNGGIGDDFLDDIFGEDESEDSERLKAFADLEQLTMIEVAAETEAVLEELKIRQGN